MGLSGSKQTTKTSTKPVYATEIKNAAATLDGVYRNQAPKIQGYADQIGGLVPDLLDKYKNGDPAINAARGYITDTLSGEAGDNPYLDDMIQMTGDNTRNQVQASMGSRGQVGGSGYADVMTRALAGNETGLRYQDYSQDMARRAQAAGMAPGIAAGDYLTLAPALSAAGFASGVPLNAAGQYAAGTGGLLGQYTNGTQTTKSSPGALGILGAGIQGAGILGWSPFG